MGQFEDYLEKKQQGELNEFSKAQVNKGIPEQEGIVMDGREMIEHVQERIENTTFQERTEYYFENTGLMSDKIKRYTRIEYGAGGVEEFSRKHQNHSADKRKKSASQAATYFARAGKLMNKYRGKDSKNSYELYSRREEIMRLRLEGMLKAAETKSTSEQHEIYLKSKARVSCLMMLRDQAQNLSQAARLMNDRKSMEKLMKKMQSLQNELKKVQETIHENLPSTADRWMEKNGLDESKYDDKALENYRGMTKNQYVSGDDLRTYVTYSTLTKQVKKYKMDYPCRTVLLDKEGQPVSRAEAKKLEWNQRYQEAVENKDQETVDKMKMEALKRIEKYPLPSLQAIHGGDMTTLFRENPAEFHEMFISAVSFCHEAAGPIREEIDTNPVLKAKINAIEQIWELMYYRFQEAGIDLRTERIYDGTISGMVSAGYENFSEKKSKLDQDSVNELHANIQSAYLKLQKAKQKSGT